MNRRVFAIFAAAVMLIASAGGAWAWIIDREHGTISTVSADWIMRYRVDDVYGKSGSGGQWIAVTASDDVWWPAVGGNPEPVPTRRTTRGGRLSSTGIKTIADIVDWPRDEIRSYLYSRNGWDYPQVTDYSVDWYEAEAKWSPMPIKHIFMVIPETTAQMRVDVQHKGPRNEPDMLDIQIGDNGYHAVKDNLGEIVPGSKEYGFNVHLSKTDDTKRQYSTVRTYLSVHQNPTEMPSQTLNIPLIIANVCNGSAKDQPLEFNAVLREANSGYVRSADAQIVASHHFKWTPEDGDLEINAGGENDWLFVPQDSKNGETARRNKFILTTDITNYSGLRYAVERFDRMPDGADYRISLISADKWRMDLESGVDDVDPVLYLDELSHVAPGLITTYNQTFDIVAARQKILRLSPVDTINDHTTPRDLWLNYKRVGAVLIGSAKTADTKGGGKATVQPFFYLANDEFFLERDYNIGAGKLGLYTKASGKSVVDAEAKMVDPTGVIPEPDKVKVDSNIETSDQNIAAVKIVAEVPEDLRYVSSSDKYNKVHLLPVLVTFKIPASQFGADWNALRDIWRRTGKIGEEFYKRYHLFALADEYVNSEYRDERRKDLSEFLRGEDAYSDNVKVMLDEANANITVSFMVMLVNSNLLRYTTIMDITDPVSLGKGISAAASDGTTHKFLTILDGTGRENKDEENRNNWDMSFYIRKGSWSPVDSSSYTPTSGSGSGGGCDAGAFASVALAAAAFAALTRKGR